MQENYIYKTYSDESKFAQIGNKIQLREYIDNLVFYNPGNLKAEYSFADHTPVYIKYPEVYDHGKFGSCIKVKSPLKYDFNNFESLNDTGTISFYAGINSITGFSFQGFVPESWPEEGLTPAEYSFNIQQGDELPRSMVIEIEEGDTYDDFCKKILFNTDPNIYNVSFDIRNGKFKSKQPGKLVKITDGTEGNNLLDFLQITETTTGCYPKKDVEILKLQNNENEKFKISFVHKNAKGNSTIEVNLYDENEKIATTLQTEWNNDGVVLNNIELDFNDELAYLFLDGKLVDVQKTDFQRINNASYLILSGIEDTSEVEEDGAAYTFDEIIILSDYVHTESFWPRTTALTRYDTTRPYIDFFYLGSNINSSIELNLNASPNTHYVLFHNDYAYYYFQGSWRISDGSFNQSNDQYTFVQYLKDYPFDGTDFSIRVIFDSDGIEPSFLEYMYFTINEVQLENEDGDTAAILVGDLMIDTTTPCGDKMLTITTLEGETDIWFPKKTETIPAVTFPVSEIMDTVNRVIDKNYTQLGDWTTYAADELFEHLRMLNTATTEITITKDDVNYKFSWNDLINKLKALLLEGTVELPQKVIEVDDGTGNMIQLTPNHFYLDDIINCLKEVMPEDFELVPETEENSIEYTLNEILEIIRDAQPEGIAKVDANSKNQVYLVSTALGSEAFIRATNDAAPYIFSGNFEAHGSDAKHDTIDYTKFKEDVKAAFGYPKIPWDIDENAFNLYIRRSMAVYNRYRSDDIHTITLKLKGNSKIGYEIPSIVGDQRNITDILVKPIFPLTIYGSDIVGDGSGDNIISLALAKSLFGGSGGVNGFPSGFTTDYYISLMNISNMKQTLGLDFKWEIMNDRIYIFPANIMRYTQVCIKYKAAVDPEKAMFDASFINLVAGLCMMHSARIKNNYGGTISTASTSTALTWNASELYSWGEKLYNDAETDLRGQQAPTGFFLG